MHTTRYSTTRTLHSYRESGQPVSDEGIDESFEVLGEVQESVSTAAWVGDCFLYTNGSNRSVDLSICSYTHPNIKLNFHRET